ncbi:hypothetical protein [Thermosporothrix hazakensis]|nr:hypothetical protein [Thermosporothrix hazakensis]
MTNDRTGTMQNGLGGLPHQGREHFHETARKMLAHPAKPWR